VTAIAIRAARVRPYTLDLGAPLVTARATVRWRRGYLVSVEDDTGTVGWGDGASFPGFGSSDEALGADLARLASELPGFAFGSPDDLDARLDAAGLTPEARFAAEVALLDLLARRRGVTLRALLDPEARPFARTHRLVTQLTRDGLAPDAEVYKLKLTGDLEVDDARVAALRALVGEAAALRLDAGGVHGEDEARRALDRLARYRVELIEQPVAAGCLEELARVRAHANALGIQVAADEDVTGRASVQDLARHRAVDLIVIKPMFAGGLLASRRLAAEARHLGLDSFVTHALESAVGRTATMQLAATLPGVHGLAWTPPHDVASPPSARGSTISLPHALGLGVAPELDALGEPPRSARLAPPLAIPSPLAASAALRPEHPALVSSEGTLTYGELAREASRVAAALAERGVAPGVRVALGGAVGREWVIGLHAILWLGGVACPLPHRGTIDELEAARRAMNATLEVDAEALPRHARSAEARSWPLEEPRVVIATSGSTGAPQAIALSASQLAWSAFGSALRLGHSLDDRWLCPLPLHHIGGLSVLIRAALGATTVVLQGAFDAKAAATVLDSGTITVASLTPTMLERILAAREALPLPDAVRVLLVGGGPASDALVAKCRELALPVALTWGMTEAASQLATRLPGDLSPLERGLPLLTTVEARMRDAALEVEGPAIGGRLTTRDRGAVSARHVVVHGRLDDAIVHGGENIDPREVERALLTHPAVRECAVVGLPSPTQGADVVAALVPDGAPTADEALRAHCRSRLAAYKIPTRFRWVSALPRTALGKLAAAAVARLFDETEPPEALEESSGQGARLHAVERDAHVHEPRAGADVVDAPLAAQRVGEGERARSELLEGDRHVEPVVQPNRLHEVRLRADKREPDTIGRDERLDVGFRGEQELFVGRVTHLEDATEEQDPRAIHLEETRRDAMNERHDHERR